MDDKNRKMDTAEDFDDLVEALFDVYKKKSGGDLAYKTSGSSITRALLDIALNIHARLSRLESRATREDFKDYER
jgi:hypothetical protein